MNQTVVTLKANEELIKRTKQNTKRSFYMVGKEQYVNHAGKGEKPEWELRGLDFIKLFRQMTSAEQHVVDLMKDCFKYNAEYNSYEYVVELTQDSIYFDEEFPDSMKYTSFRKAYNLLFKKDLMRKIKRNHYMLNPDFFCIGGEQAAFFERIWAESKQYEQK